MPSLLISLAEEFGNRLLRQDPDTLERLAALEGKVIALVIEDSSLKLYVRPFGGGLRLSEHAEETPDVTLAGTLPAFLRLAASRGDSAALFEGKVVLGGDSRLAQRFQRVLSRLDIDWEAWLARYTGDVAAYQLARGLRAGQRWVRGSVATLGRDAAEYFQEEQPELARPDEVAEYMDAVDGLRGDVERLEQKLRLLQERLVS
jgi:ubiquinone biosynthesis protein UbiJ